MDIQKVLMKPGICFFLIKDNELLKKYNKTWNKVNNSNENGFDSEPVQCIMKNI